MKRSNAGNKVNRGELAAVFGVAVTTVDAWVRAGCPFDQRGAGKGRPWIFDTADVARWREERAAADAAGDTPRDADALKLRKLAADAAMAELELLKAKEQVASVDAVERVWSRVLAELQAGLRGAFITRSAVQVVGETDERAIKRVLRAEVDACLEVLAGMNLDEPSDLVDVSDPAED